VENESYCWALSRYLHLNPVRAKMVDRPEDYAWSSYRHYLRSRTAPEWLDWRTVLAEIGNDPAGARKRYRRFVEQGIEDKIASPLKEVVGKVLLGSAAWVEEMRKTLSATEADRNIAELRHLAWRPSPGQIELAVAEAFAVDLSRLFAKRIRNNEARAAAVYLNRMLTSMSATELAERYGGVSQAAISKTDQRAETRRRENRRWNQTLARLEKSLRPMT
jgi:hypothetical protein